MAVPPPVTNCNTFLHPSLPLDLDVLYGRPQRLQLANLITVYRLQLANVITMYRLQLTTEAQKSKT